MVSGATQLTLALPAYYLWFYSFHLLLWEAVISKKRAIPEGGGEIKKILWLLFWKEERIRGLGMCQTEKGRVKTKKGLLSPPMVYREPPVIYRESLIVIYREPPAVYGEIPSSLQSALNEWKMMGIAQPLPLSFPIHLRYITSLVLLIHNRNTECSFQIVESGRC